MKQVGARSYSPSSSPFLAPGPLPKAADSPFLAPGPLGKAADTPRATVEGKSPVSRIVSPELSAANTGLKGAPRPAVKPAPSPPVVRPVLLPGVKPAGLPPSPAPAPTAAKPTEPTASPTPVPPSSTAGPSLTTPVDPWWPQDAPVPATPGGRSSEGIISRLRGVATHARAEPAELPAEKLSPACGATAMDDPPQKRRRVDFCLEDWRADFVALGGELP